MRKKLCKYRIGDTQMIYMATLINATGDTYQIPIQAESYEQAVTQAKQLYGSYVQWVKHTPED